MLQTRHVSSNSEELMMFTKRFAIDPLVNGDNVR